MLDGKKKAVCLFVVLIIFNVGGVGTGVVVEDSWYSLGEVVPLYANKFGPYNNPEEVYSFSDQNVFCQLERKEVKDMNLGEKLEEGTKTVYLFELQFGKSFPAKLGCSLKYGPEELQKVKNMIKRNFYYEFFYDDIPIHGFVGQYKTSSEQGGMQVDKYYLYSHYQFFIEYNQPEGSETGYVVYANLTRDPESIVSLTDSIISIDFRYSATWIKQDIPFKERHHIWKKHAFTNDIDRTEMETHWFSLLSSLVLVLILSGLALVILLRLLRRDIMRYITETDQEEPEFGWKMVANDVFRFPPNSNLFCALVGVGTQFIVMTVLVLALAVFGLTVTDHGAMYVACIVLYVLTALISGYVSATWYRMMSGTHWQLNIILTVTIFAVPFFGMVLIVNGIAITHHVTKALPFTTILTVLTIWAFGGIPLTIIGAITGRNRARTFTPPVRVKPVPSPLPSLPWYRKPSNQILIGGILPFTAISMELYYIFQSVWVRGFYQWGILFILFIILLIVTATTSILLLYFLLSIEDYRWWWFSFLSSGSTGFFMFAYSIFYYKQSSMSGIQQGSFYFGYQLFLCYYFFLVFGAVGFFSSYRFVRKLYSNFSNSD